MSGPKLERLEDYLSEDARRFMVESSADFMPVVEDVYTIGARKQWFVVYTNPKCETKAEDGFKAKRWGSYAPRSTDWRKQSRREKHQKAEKVPIVRPLLTRYVLVELPVHERWGVPFGAASAIDGVREFVGNAQGPLTLSTDIVEALREREKHGEFDKTVMRRVRGGKTIVPSWVGLGKSIRITSGPFASFLAVIQEILPREMVTVGVDIFGRGTPVTLDLAQVEEVR